MSEPATTHTGKSESKIQAAVFVIGMIFLSALYLYRQAQSDSKSEDLSPYSVSALSPTYRWGDHDTTVLVAIRTGCKYCEASKGFYSRLIALEREGRMRSHLIFVLPDGDRGAVPEDAGDDQVFMGTFSSLGVTKTPTILVVSKFRKIRSAWVGQLSSDREQGFMEFLRHADR
jgi:hypothetical protein